MASWGASEFGQLGQGGEELSQPLPRIVKGGAKDVRFARWGGRQYNPGWAVHLQGGWQRRVVPEVGFIYTIAMRGLGVSG